MPLVLKQTSAPSEDPISTSDFKTHAKIDIADDDAYISALISGAVLELERLCRIQFVIASWTYKIDRFPSSNEIKLFRPPLATVTSIQYIDGDGATQTLSTSIYDVHTTESPGRITLAFDQEWPETREEVNAITIVYQAGFATASAVPEDFKHMVKFLVAHWHENREPVVIGTIVAELPFALQSMIISHSFPEAG